MTNLKFIFYCNDKLLKKITFSGNEAMTVSIGRDDADVHIPEGEVSRMHAQLIYDGSGVYVMDCNSTNGTFVNNKKLSGNEPVLLSKGDVVGFGSHQKSKLMVSAAEQQHAANGVDDGSISKSILSKLNEKNQVTIGRGQDCDIVLAHHTVSRRHATVTKNSGGKYTVVDEGSLNGVFVNGKRVKKAELGVNDRLYIGRFELSLEGAQRNLSYESAIRANQVSKKYRNGFHALKETTFDLPSGGLIAIMGPSGCGKSTLLKVLNGSIFPTTGNVFVNGLDLIENFGYLKTQIGYVPQDDIVHTELTVRQSIYYAAKIRLNGVSDEIIEKKTSALLKRLNIEKISENLVGKISGGQRKRVSIAVELLSDPAILFLDEPTSPLDPQTIAEFMGILRALSETGTTIIMVTHKLEDLNYMDRVIFMAEGGALVFYGNVNEYKNYFNVDNAIDVYSNISGDKATFWIKKFAEHLASKALPPAPHKRKDDKTDPFTQFYWLLARYFKVKVNDKKNTAIMILQAPVIALLICLVFKEVKLAVLFLVTISGIWFGVNNSAREIVSEGPIYKRERMFNVLIFPYVFSKVVLLAIFAFIQAFLFVSIISWYYNDQAPKWDPWISGILWMFLITFCSSLLGLFISSANDNTEKAMSVVPIIIIPQIMLAGVLTVINNSIVELLSYFTISRWGTEGFTHIQKGVLETVTDQRGIPIKQPGVSYDIMKRSFHDTYRMVFGEYAGTFQLNAVVLTFMSALFLAGIWIFLIKKDKAQF
jgi:ABC-type multidrug transport system ATPase subunit/pSer/pThr/pTyr-binding forkhead associated (FHA) protein/ABC-type multidrug transport system permease subunit